VGVILFILDKMGIGGIAVYAFLFALAMGLCVDSVIRSDWSAGSKTRKTWGGVGMSAFYLIFGAWIFLRPHKKAESEINAPPAINAPAAHDSKASEQPKSPPPKKAALSSQEVERNKLLIAKSKALADSFDDAFTTLGNQESHFTHSLNQKMKNGVIPPEVYTELQPQREQYIAEYKEKLKSASIASIEVLDEMRTAIPERKFNESKYIEWRTIFHDVAGGDFRQVKPSQARDYLNELAGQVPH